MLFNLGRLLGAALGAALSPGRPMRHPPLSSYISTAPLSKSNLDRGGLGVARPYPAIIPNKPTLEQADNRYATSYRGIYFLYSIGRLGIHFGRAL